ncbi:hypothetical protein C2E23DRAFT_318884 [Lenzites betulinus]|nr:hypothetical protein C2E23DRAFT_318884 [Lenzites betulinus]
MLLRTDWPHTRSRRSGPVYPGGGRVPIYGACQRLRCQRRTSRAHIQEMQAGMYVWLSHHICYRMGVLPPPPPGTRLCAPGVSGLAS